MPPKKNNFLTSFVDWFQRNILGKPPEKPIVVREIVEQTLQPSDLPRQYMAMLNKMQRLKSPEKWIIASWKAIPLEKDPNHFYYLFCFQVPYESQHAQSIILSTGVRKFLLKRSQGKQWGQHRIQVFRTKRREDVWDVLYSRNALFIGEKVMADPNLNAAITMTNLAKQLLLAAIRKMEWRDWEFQVQLAIAGWGDLVESGELSDLEDYRTLDKK